MTASVETQFIDPQMRLAELARSYMDALLARERNKAQEMILQAVEDGTEIKDVYLQVFQPVQYEVGWLWQSGAISVGQEHYCTNATQLLMSMLYPRIFTGASSDKRLLAACVQGELHELGLRMLADFFEMEGWNTDYLGANTPRDSIVGALEEMRTDLLAIGVTMHDHVEDAQLLISAVRERPRLRSIPILVGGYTFMNVDALWQKIGADGTARDARQAIGLASELTSTGSKYDS